MSFVLIVSVLLKGIGAILEVALQVAITKEIGVTDYGVYSTLVNAADLIYWCLFSGLVKCNTFYLSEDGTTIRRFQKRYYFCYAGPVCCLGIVAAFLMKRYAIGVVFATALAELLVMDQSSTFMARRRSKRALFGEYVLGRFLLLIGVMLLFSFSKSSVISLILLYLAQFLLIEVYFICQKRFLPPTEQERAVSLKKWSSYQRADIIQSMIGQMPILLQYWMVGSFEAGVVSVVMLVKKLVHFISGPSFKIFLPEFSRLYQAGNKEGIQRCFGSIIRIQMLFLAPMSVVLIGFPDTLLTVMAEELLPYQPLFILCSVTFLMIASLGPCSGLMQMTGNERWDNRFREMALLGMLVVFFALRKNPFFVLYGLCAQTILENTGKLLFILRWMGGLPLPLMTYLRFWVLPVAMIGTAYGFHLQSSLIGMVLFSGFTFFVNLLMQMKQENLLEALKNRKNS
ncbi:MAG: hypothetical protein MJ077_08450 [Oscillospiraceae bacterium]|nr:hypothetical protein [Oscillospiraceae bacterium]